ncbi:unnamed protein product [Bursaphelenchus okinawaensis]|uniref:F-box domain-containing protein n=1 Tax=Bursaphelenchus okinawaensis TaxID=465554 RepID=A0A811LMH2_9BILA|nr:unnamed protein product [Bursaphelenchus okinawaensis]CAG9124147.1 unnamed protein product [Bursaphelenchus okinawaensis]
MEFQRRKGMIQRQPMGTRVLLDKQPIFNSQEVYAQLKKRILNGHNGKMLSRAQILIVKPSIKGPVRPFKYHWHSVAKIRRSFFRKKPEQFWPRIVDYLAQEDVCTLAQTNKYFYKLINMDFQSLCYRNLIFRLKDETWSTAFSNAQYRKMSRIIWRKDEAKLSKNSFFCPHTGTMAVVLKYKQVMLTNLDFGKKVFELLNFRGHKGYLLNVQLINKSTKLIVDMKNTYVVYDLVKKRVVKVYSARPEERYSTFTLYYGNGVLVDVYNQREYPVFPIKVPKMPKIYNVDAFGYRKYVGFVNVHGHFILIHTDTGRMQFMFSVDVVYFDQCGVMAEKFEFERREICIMDDLGFVRNTNFFKVLVYEINTERCILDVPARKTSFATNCGVDGLHFTNKDGHGNIVKKFLFFPMINIFYKTNGDRDKKEFMMVDWSTGRMVTKLFRTEIDEKKNQEITSYYVRLSSIKPNTRGVTVDTPRHVRHRFEEIIDELSASQL